MAKDHCRSATHRQDLAYVGRRRELHRGGERHQQVTGLAVSRDRNDQRDHDDDEHRQVPVVLDVDEAVPEVREVQIKDGEEVPPRLQEIPDGQREKQRGEQDDHAVELDSRRRSGGIQPRRRQQSRRRIGGGRLTGPGRLLERRLLEALLRVHVERIVQDNLGDVGIADRVGAVGVVLLNAAQERDAGVIDVGPRHVRDRDDDHMQDRGGDHGVLNGAIHP